MTKMSPPSATDGKHSGIGAPVRRREDLRLVRGAGRYTADENLPGQVHAVMVRSPHAHALIRAIGAEKALALPGVLAVLTGTDFLADGLKPIPHKPWSPHPAEIVLHNSDGSEAFTPPHYPLPADKARFVGEAVAMVVAKTLLAAKDGAERVEVDYEVLPAVTETTAAARQDAPRVHEGARSNVCIDAEIGDAAATAAAFARATHVARFETWVRRVTGVPMEPRAVLAAYDPESGRYTVYAGNGGAVRLKNDIAAILDVPADKVRVLMQDVGGNFGTRGMIYPEFALAAWAARRVGRPVKWICERHESFLSDYQTRDLAAEAELALDAHGNFLAMRGANLGNLGAHSTSFSMVQKGVEIMSSIYRVPAAHFRARAVLSNSSPTRPYRSAGRPEVIFVIERLIDVAAREFAFDRVELRRRNLVTAAEMPYKNPFGMGYDSGDYPAVSLTVFAPTSRITAIKRPPTMSPGTAPRFEAACKLPNVKGDKFFVHRRAICQELIGCRPRTLEKSGICSTPHVLKAKSRNMLCLSVRVRRFQLSKYGIPSNALSTFVFPRSTGAARCRVRIKSEFRKPFCFLSSG